MLDTDTKRRIDTARDILVGKVPDPKSQVEQITIALIYKFMDDMDASVEEIGGERSFFAGEYARYGWAKLMRSGLGGHGKADIKRLHYQEGRFALANTMCALFVKDEAVVRPRYLHIFLSAMCQELLVPLMCGATNVTMSSDQLADVIIPVPNVLLQDEVIESALIGANAAAMTEAAVVLRDSSSDKDVVKLAEKVIRETEAYLKGAKKRITVSEFIPS